MHIIVPFCIGYKSGVLGFLEYSIQSGQKTNLLKIVVSFSPNTAYTIWEMNEQALDVMMVGVPEKYLSLPSQIGCNKLKHFKILKERVRKLKSWKDKLFF